MEAASVPAESGGQQGEAPDAGGSPQFDMGPVLDRVGQVGQSFDSFADQFNQKLEALENRLPQEPGGSEYDDDMGLDDPSLYGDDGEMDPAQAQQFLEQIVDKRATALSQQHVQQAVEPIMQQLDELQQERAANEILGEFPELADEQRAEAFMDTAGGIVDSLGLPDEVASRVVTSAPFLRLVAQASRHQEASRNEQPVGSEAAREHQLEPAGGANLGGGEPDLARSIVNARQKGPAGAFWMG